MKVVLAAILWLAPQLGHETAEDYAGLITGYAEKYEVDPLLVVAIIHTESRFNSRAKSKTGDHGLMQVHVSVTTYKRYLGREHLLLEPKRNIRLGIRLLRQWKDYHERTCTGRHPFWAHYGWGVHVPRKRGVRSVDELYHVLLARFETS
jgi:soluble lytic murein transglycosylase-like protein